MDARVVCAPLFADPDSETDTISAHNAAFVPETKKIINTEINSTQVKGSEEEEELLEGLLTDKYCHVCEAILAHVSQRLSHYEGKKHAQKVRAYLKNKRGEKTSKESVVPQQPMTADKDHFCELCNMLFSSPVVAKSHYEGKVHSKNLRKHGLPPQAIQTLHQISASEGTTDKSLEAKVTTMNPLSEVDLKDPNKYCSLCTASFNNPQMAQQHYNGRKHQRNRSKQELLKELGDKDEQDSSLKCHICSAEFNSVEMYQSHMQGNKHQIKEKKVMDLCKSQQKVYSTFADELEDYIKVQKARGISTKIGAAASQMETHKEQEEGFKCRHSSLPLAPEVPHYSQPGGYYPVQEWHAPFPSQCWDFSHPPLAPQFTGRPTKRRRHRKQSSSSSFSSSSSYSSSDSSSSSGSSSDSDDSEDLHRESRHRRRSKKEREKTKKGTNQEQRKHRKHRRERNNDSDKKSKLGLVGKEKRRKKQKHTNLENMSREEAVKKEKLEKDSWKSPDSMDKRNEVHVQAVELEEVAHEESDKHKFRKEKKKPKEKVDTRTEEEKLWDDSILGC